MKGNFHTGREKSSLQCEFIGSRWITQIVRHSNEVGDSTFWNIISSVQLESTNLYP